jgi:hypothetical protein
MIRNTTIPDHWEKNHAKQTRTQKGSFPQTTASPLTPLHRPPLLCTLHRQLNHPDPHPRLLSLHNDLLLPSNRRHNISIVIQIRALRAGNSPTPERTFLLLGIVELRLSEKLAVVVVWFDAVGGIGGCDSGEELVDLRVFAVLRHESQYCEAETTLHREH